MCEKDPDKICNCCALNCASDCYNSNHVSQFTRKRDLFNSTSWFDTTISLQQIRKGKASGNKAALVIRDKFQRYIFDCGCIIQKKPGSVLFIGLLALITFCVGLKSATIETNIEKLWIEVGGRLSKETEYITKTLGDGFGNTNQLIIQTPKDEKSNVLHPNSLLLHLEAIKHGTQVTVEMFEVTWRLKDICYSLNMPGFEEPLVDETLEKLMPCAIITPLDCFWESSKLLGPEDDIRLPFVLNKSLKWTNFNPLPLLEFTKITFTKMASEVNPWETHNRYPLKTFENLMDRAGISTAYQKRPCLNPKDEDCPITAPNKDGREPDVGAELTGGCYGFATNLMHWPEELIVGGIKKNKTGHIVKASALQSIIQLMAEQDMFEYWQNHYKVHNIDWNVEKARIVLEAWQRKFAQEVEKYIQHHQIDDYYIEQFTNVALLDIMKNFSKLNIHHLLVGYFVILLYTATVRSNPKDCVESHSFLGVIGVLIVALSIASGLGFCSIIGLPFNATTTQIIPFLSLGYGTAFLFLIIATYDENLKSNTHQENIIAETLKQVGFSIFVNAVCVACSFGAAYIIPIPALRYFVAQTAAVIAFITISLFVLFPAAIKLDLVRRRSHRLDLFCCFKAKSNDERLPHPRYKPMNNNRVCRKESKDFVIKVIPSNRMYNLPSSKDRSSAKKELNNSVNSPFIPPKRFKKHPLSLSSSLSSLSSSSLASCKTDSNHSNGDDTKLGVWDKISLSYFVQTVYVPLLLNRLFKLLILIVSTILLLVCLNGLPKVRDGLNLTDIVPRDTSEYRFLHTQRRFFNVYNMYAVTQGNFEYPNNQKLLMEFHAAFTRVPKIIKNDNGGLPDFWLTLFRDWLIGLQKAFDDDWKRRAINQERWFPNASADGILAYKLLVQTGRVDNPVDKSLVSKVRLVDEKGIINPKAFYNYLTAWVTNDALAYSASQANFHPEPRQWIHIANDYELKIPKSQPLVYAQMPFYLNDMDTTEEITATIKEIRSICKTYEEKGLPNFPTGLPFTYWEQYIRLRLFLSSSFVIVFSIIFLVVCIILFNPWAASLLVILMGLNVVEVFGLMGLMGIQLSAVPAVILVISVGKGSNILVHLLMGFLTSIGKRNNRMGMALHNMFSPLFLGQISAFLGIGMLAFSEFDFIIRDFFCVFCAEIAVSSFNGFFLFPVLLSLIGPSSELTPFKHEGRISTPSPPNSPPVKLKYRTPSYMKRHYPRAHSELSLSTISEERSSYQSSHEIVVQPELVVETTTVTNTTPQQILTHTTSSNLRSEKSGEGFSSSSDRDSPESPMSRESPAAASDSGASTLSSSSSATTSTINAMGGLCPFQQQTVTTKVTTTAKLKVELHAPYLDRDYSNMNRNKSKDRRPSRS